MVLYSKVTCDSRSEDMKSSKYYSSTLTVGGIFDNDPAHSVLSTVNKVFVPYCSSDGWIGNASASNLTWGYEFRGQEIIRSVLSDLVYRYDINSESKIVFGGASAGARGMMNNVDFLVSYLPSGATVIGAVLDSPFYMDLVSYDPEFVGFPYQTIEIYNRYNVDAIIPDDCAATYTNELWYII